MILLLNTTGLPPIEWVHIYVLYSSKQAHDRRVSSACLSIKGFSTTYLDETAVCVPYLTIHCTRKSITAPTTCIVRTEREYPRLTGILVGSVCSRGGSGLKVLAW